ncbi:MAG TPA: RluA family pseudouridine synthase [Alphaproteobacteria bacterium]|nr:RluA family pseudouridine synthase [Alphaproteobacteria bacterium]
MAAGDPFHVTIQPAQSGERLDRALLAGLAAAMPALSRTRVKALIESGAVQSGDFQTVTDPGRRVRPGQTFAIMIPEAQPITVEGQSIPLDVVYEDADVIVVDKPAGMVVHPAPGNPDRTLVNALIAHCGASLKGIGGVQRPGIVHRLDKDTSGLIVAAKTDAAHQSLVEQFSTRSVERVYAALVWGVPQPRRGEISGAIGRSRTDRKKMAVLRQGGKPALTRYEVKCSFADGAISLLDCRLATGRTHQIRVHLTALGNPLLGDPVYGRARLRQRALPASAADAIAALGRQALDAYVLGFKHPATGRLLRFEKKLSLDINQLIRTLESV